MKRLKKLSIVRAELLGHYHGKIYCNILYLYNRYHCVCIISVLGGNLSIIHCFPVCHYLYCWFMGLSLTPSNPHCNCGLLRWLFLSVSFWFLFLFCLASIAAFVSLSADCELISSFERVMIPLCWDYVCVPHTVMAWLFIACCILIPQLKKWDDTCRELCVSCSLTWKNSH